jgi:hypothetical protein
LGYKMAFAHVQFASFLRWLGSLILTHTP